MLEIASVVGSDFSWASCVRSPAPARTGIKLSLNRLRRLELAQPSGAYVGDEPVWRFHHVLIRDVAYRRLLKSDRADLHERLADWVEAGGASVAFDSDEMVARHLEAAHTYRLELGTVDEHTGDLALRSARHYAASARRALDRDELVSAGNSGGSRRSTCQRRRRGCTPNCCSSAARHSCLRATSRPAHHWSTSSSASPTTRWRRGRPATGVSSSSTPHPERLLEVDARLQGAIDEFGRRTDPAGLAKAHRVRASARFRLGRIGDCEVDLFEALIAARQSGDHRQITAALGAAPGAALWGPSPVPKAGGRCLDVVRMQRMTTAAPSLEATSMRHLAVLELLRGRPDKARTMLADARQVVADLGLRHGLMETELFAGIIESMEGDPVAAEPHFRTALEGLDALGVGADAGQAAALLARSVLAQGRVDEADRYATESERLAGRNLKTAIAWRAVRAEILAAQGRHDEAAAMARDAVCGRRRNRPGARPRRSLPGVEPGARCRRGYQGRQRCSRATPRRCMSQRKWRARSVGRRRPVVPPSPAAATAARQRRGWQSRMSPARCRCRVCRALCRRHDVDGVVGFTRTVLAYDDRRRFSGDPVEGS